MVQKHTIFLEILLRIGHGNDTEMDEYSQYARVANGSVFVTFTVAVAGKYFVILPIGFGRETRQKQWAIYPCVLQIWGPFRVPLNIIF